MRVILSPSEQGPPFKSSKFGRYKLREGKKKPAGTRTAGSFYFFYTTLFSFDPTSCSKSGVRKLVSERISLN